MGPAGWIHHSRNDRIRITRDEDQNENGGPSRWKRPASPSTNEAVHLLGRYGFGSWKKPIARKPALTAAEWGTPAGTKYSSPRRHVRVALSIVKCISPSTTIPHWAP